MTERTVAGTSRRHVIEAGFQVLRALPDADRLRQVASLAELTSLPRSTVHRMLGQLRQSGAVELDPDGRWQVSPGLMSVTSRVEPVNGLRKTAMPVMLALREHTGASVSLVVPTQNMFIALEMIPGREELHIDARAGARMPNTAAAALLLGSPHEAASRMRAFGGAVDNEDVMEGLSCYAVSLALPGRRLASLQIATSTRRTTAETFAPMVRRAAASLETRITRRGSRPRN